MTKPYHTEILRVRAGSHLYGLATPDSDTDYLGVAIEHPRDLVGLGHWEQVITKTYPEGQTATAIDTDITVHGLRKFCKLAVAGNPSILEVLFAPDEMQTRSTSYSRELQALAPFIVSKQAIPRYRGYMASQAKRLTGEMGRGRGARTGARPELVEKYGWDTKFGAHMLRLGYMGLTLARTGVLILPLPKPHIKLLMDVRNGKWTVHEALYKAFEIDAELAEKEKECALPDAPCIEKIDEWLVSVYQRAWA